MPSAGIGTAKTNVGVILILNPLVLFIHVILTQLFLTLQASSLPRMTWESCCLVRVGGIAARLHRTLRRHVANKADELLPLGNRLIWTLQRTKGAFSSAPAALLRARISEALPNRDLAARFSSESSWSAPLASTSRREWKKTAPPFLSAPRLPRVSAAGSSPPSTCLSDGSSPPSARRQLAPIHPSVRTPVACPRSPVRPSSAPSRPHAGV